MKGRYAVAACVGLVLLSGLACAQKAAKPKVSADPLSAEQLAVYRAVLAGWMQSDGPPTNLSVQTVPLQDSIGYSGNKECGKGLSLEPLPEVTVHRFRPQDLLQLGAERALTLIDPERGNKEVDTNDPGKAIRGGQSIDNAVRNGFAHGLITVSEIQFDKKHEHAIVSYGFRCGGLCGNGGTVVVEKKDGVWKFQSRCDEWISSDSPAHGNLASAADV